MGFWRSRRPLLAVGGATAVLIAVTVMLLRDTAGPDLAQVLGFPLAVVGTAVAIWGLWPRPSLARVARDLAARIVEERERDMRQALADTGDPQPADLGFRRPEAATEPELVGWRDDHGAAGGTLRQIVGYYQALERGRMVILGEPGAGKTVAATRLVLDLVRALPVENPAPDSGGRIVVPVPLSLPAWRPPYDEIRQATDLALVAMLDGWIAKQLMEVYGVRRAHVVQLMADGWVLPVLDGLDEMDAGDGPRTRAAAVVRALNLRGRRPVILVCRRGDYAGLASEEMAVPGDVPVLQDAQQVILQDLSSEQIGRYLIHRFPHRDRPDTVQPRWQPVLDAVETPAGAPLRSVLGRPWRLFLVVNAYHAPGSDPVELTRIPPDSVAPHLMARLIPAMTARHPRSTRHRRDYDPQQVHAWLTTLARHLRDTSTRHGWSPTDLYLDDLWPTAGWRTPRYAASAFRIAIFAAIAMLVAVPAAQDGTLTEIPTLVLLAMVGVAGAAVGWQSLDPDPDLPYRLDLRQVRTSAGRNRLAANLFGFLILGVAMGFLIGFAIGIAVGLAVGVTGGLAGGLNAIERPSDLMRQSLAFDLLQGLALGTAVALSIVITTEVTLFGIAVGIPFGFALGVLLSLGISRWPRYWFACALTIPRRRLPPRPSLFLDWAYAAGLLRLSGIGTQFRHREFQQWLESGTGSP